MEKRRKTEITQALLLSRSHLREGPMMICALIHKVQPQQPAQANSSARVCEPVHGIPRALQDVLLLPQAHLTPPHSWVRLRAVEHLGTEARLHSDFRTGTASPDGPVCKAAAQLCSLTAISYFSVGPSIRQDLFFLEEG